MYKHYGWEVSPYSVKTRAYLRFKQLPFEDLSPTMAKLAGMIRKKVGRMVMPTVELPDGRWLQDTSVIIDHFEGVRPEPSVTPDGAVGRYIAYLLECFADEWLPLSAMHYRWTEPETVEFIREQFGQGCLPGAPRMLRDPLAKRMMSQMSGYLPVLGIDERTADGIVAMTGELLDLMEAHFADHLFIQGSRPSLADFSLLGPIRGHLFGDPGSRHLFDTRPRVIEWIDRCYFPSGNEGSLFADDAIPDTCTAIVRMCTRELGPYVKNLNRLAADWMRTNTAAERLPRSLGVMSFAVGGYEGERKSLMFSLWMAQRVAEARASDPGAVDAWLSDRGADPIQLTLDRRLEYRDNYVWFA